MERLAQFCTRFAWLILAATATISVLAATQLGKLGYDDDIMGFLPDGDPEVGRFLEIGKRFGGLNVALLGIESTDLFTTERLRFVQQLTERLGGTQGVQSVTSLTNVKDFSERRAESGEQQSVVGSLVGEIPTDPQALAALRGKVLSKDHIIGSLVSKDGGSALLLIRLIDNASALETARRMRSAAESLQPEKIGLRLQYGGSPFVSEAMARASQSDLSRLAPFIIGSILLIVLVSFGSLVGMLVSLLSVSLAILWTAGLMAALGRPLTLISSSFPLLLVAIGSAYSIHLLSRYLKVADAGTTGRLRLTQTLKQVGVPLIIAGLLTAVSFASFVAMDIGKMREFGLFMAIGILFTLAIALFFVPAVLSRFPLRASGAPRFAQRLARVALWSFDRLRPSGTYVLLGLLILIGLAAFFIPLVTFDMSTRSYFNEEDEAVRADRFFVDRFGGSMFLQLEAQGDIRDPAVLDELEKFQTFTSRIAGVSQVQSIADVIRLGYQGLWGRDLLPTTREQVASLSFLTAQEDPSVALLVDPNWEHALIQVRLGGFNTAAADRIAEQVRDYIRSQLAAKVVTLQWRGAGAIDRTSPTAALVLQRATERLAWVLYGLQPPQAGLTAIREVLQKGFGARAEMATTTLTRDVQQRLTADLIEDEYIYLTDGQKAVQQLVPRVMTMMQTGQLTEEALYKELIPLAAEQEQADEQAARQKGPAAAAQSGFRRAVRKIHGALSAIEDEARRKSVLVALAAATPDASAARGDRQVSRQISRVVDGLLDDHVYLPAKDMAPAAESGDLPTTDLQVAVSGYPVLLAGMNRSVQHNQLRSMALAAGLFLLVMLILFRSIGLTLVCIAPSVLTLMMLFGALGALNTPMDMGTTMLSSICIGIGIDYPIHLLWGLRRFKRRGPNGAIDAALALNGPSICVNVLNVAFGFGFLAFATLAPISRLGMLIAAAMVLSGIASLVVMPLLVTRFDLVRRIRPGKDDDGPDDIASAVADRSDAGETASADHFDAMAAPRDSETKSA